MKRISAVFLLLSAPLLAQNSFTTGRAAPLAATGPTYEASLGYVYVSMPMPSQRATLTGGDANGCVRFNARWGATLDVTYAHSGDMLGTRYSGSLLSGLVGPAFYPPMHGSAVVFIHALAGGARVDGAFPVGKTTTVGWEGHPSYALGGGVEYHFIGPFNARAQADYQRTTFYGETGGLRGQNNLRFTMSIVYRLGNRLRPRL